MSHPVAAEFLKLYFDDLARGETRRLEDYLEMFPGSEEVIRREWTSLDSPETAPKDERSRAADDRSIAPGAMLGSYRIERQLGRGGFGVVWLATDTRVDRAVAIKMLVGDDQAGDAIARFRREAAAVARLDHPNIGTLFEAVLDDPKPYLVLRYVEGETLAAQFARNRSAVPGDWMPTLPAGAHGTVVSRTPESLRRVVAFFALVAEAVGTAHAEGIVHRDLKPGNVMVRPDGQPVVLDFGLARREGEATLTRADEIIGTPAYMAPECIASGTAGPRSDVYAIGVMIYEALALKRPFARSTVQAEIGAAAVEEAPRLSSFWDAIPSELDAIVETAIDSDPTRRYADARSMAADLRAVLSGAPVSVRPHGFWRRLEKRVKRRPVEALLVALLILVLGVVGKLGWDAYRQRQTELRERNAKAIEEDLQTGYFELGQKNLTGAEAAFDRVLEVDPMSEEARGGLAVVAMIEINAPNPEWETDGMTFEQRLESFMPYSSGARPPIDAATPTGAFLRGWAIVAQTGLPDAAMRAEAVRAFRAAVSLAPRARPIYHFELARAAGLAGDLETARSTAESIKQLWPKSHWGAFHAAFGLNGAGDYDGAIAEYRRALSIEPRHRLSLLGLGAATMGKGDFAAAAAIYRDVLAEDPNDWTAHQNLGGCLKEQGLPEAAALEWKAAAKLDPGNVDLLQTLAQHYIGTGPDGFDEARSFALKAIALEPEAPAAHVALGVIAGEGGDGKTAFAHFKRAASGKADNEQLHLNLLAAARMLGDRQAERDELERWAKQKRMDIEAQVAFAEALLASGDLDDRAMAQEAAKRALLLIAGGQPASAELVRRAHSAAQ